MGYDLENRDGLRFRFNTKGWKLVLHLAERYGWQPAGTVCEAGTLTEEECYLVNGGQEVSAPDAVALAAALAKALGVRMEDRLI